MKWGAIIVGVLVALFVITGLAGGFDTDDSAVTEGQETSETEEAPATPGDQFSASVADIVDDPVVTVGEEKTTVEYSLDSVTPRSVQDETLDILTAAKESGLDTSVEVIASTELVSELGESREGEILRVGYSPELIARMEPGNMDRANVWEVADGAQFVHPGLR